MMCDKMETPQQLSLPFHTLLPISFFLPIPLLLSFILLFYMIHISYHDGVNIKFYKSIQIKTLEANLNIFFCI